MFLHKENQQLLWNTLQKSPYLVEFTQKFAGYRQEWFRGAIEQFYTQWISRNQPLPTNARELLEINKYALQTMVADLKRLLGYPSNISSQQNGNYHGVDHGVRGYQPYVATQGVNATSHVTPQNGFDMPSYKVAAQNELPSYDVNAERKQREDEWSANFNKYQTEYNQLLKQPAVPTRGLPSETGGEKIKNMDELIREHAKMRDMDLSIYSPPTPNPPTSYPSPKQPTDVQVTRLKILDEIERLDYSRIDDQRESRRELDYSRIDDQRESRRELHLNKIARQNSTSTFCAIIYNFFTH